MAALIFETVVEDCSPTDGKFEVKKILMFEIETANKTYIPKDWKSKIEVSAHYLKNDNLVVF